MCENILIWLQEPQIDIFQISDYIMKDSMFYASKTAKDIQEKVQDLPFFPFMGRMVPEINEYYVRELIYKLYRIIYQIFKNKIYIIRIIHSSRNLLNS